MRGRRWGTAAGVTAGLALGLAAPLSVAAPSASAAQLVIRSVAGTGKPCRTPPACGDFGFARAATLSSPAGVELDRAGNVFIADRGDNEIRAAVEGFAPLIVRSAGTGSPCAAPPACGDGGPAVNATLSSPNDVAVEPRAGLIIADTQDNEVRRILPSNTITRIAGAGTRCTGPPNCGDGGPATSAQLSQPDGVAVDSPGNVYIADTGDNEIRKLRPDGTIIRFAGVGGLCQAPPSCGDGGRATNAELSDPRGVAVDTRGNVYIADTGDNEIRKVSPNGIIHRVAGDGLICVRPPRCGDGGRALNAALNFPSAVAWQPGGALYVADTGDQEIRKISPSARMSRLAGRGARCQRTPSCGNNGPPLAASLNSPRGVAVDRAGDVWMGDSGNNQVRIVAPRSRSRFAVDL